MLTLKQSGAIDGNQEKQLIQSLFFVKFCIYKIELIKLFKSTYLCSDKCIL